MAWISFIISFSGGILGILYLLEGSTAIKGFLIMAFIFAVSSCFTLAKAVRDKHEEKQILNKVEKAKTEKLLSNYKD